MSDTASIVVVFGVAVAAALALGGFFTYLAPNYDGLVELKPFSEATPLSANANPASVISANYRYEDGTHTYSGSIDLPTPCHQLFSSTEFDGEEPGHVLLSFKTSSVSDICAQVITPQTFFMEFQGSPGMKATARLNGKTIPLTIVEQ